MNCLTVSINMATEMGLEIYASQPPSRMRSSSPFMAKAVTATTGIDAELIVLLQPFGDFEPRHLRQLNVHEDEVGAMLAGERQRLHAVSRLQGLVAMRVEQVVEELHVEFVVLHDQNGLGHRPRSRRFGRHMMGDLGATCHGTRSMGNLGTRNRGDRRTGDLGTIRRRPRNRPEPPEHMIAPILLEHV